MLEAVFRAEYEGLVGLARLLLDERGQAEEIVQEAFARTYAGWPRVRDHADPLPYVRQSVVNLARSGLRRRITARAHRAERAVDAPSAEADAVAATDRRDVLAAVRGLARRQRECVVLRFYLDATGPEIALTLGISEGSVKQHLHRAMEHLAVMLEEHR